MSFRYAMLVLAFMASGSVAGCTKSRNDAPHNTEEKPAMTITYQVGHLPEGSFVPLGTITFDESHKGTLSINKEGAAAGKLREAWAEVADKDKVFVKRSEVSENEKGEEVSRYVGVEVARSNEDFPQAVMEYLSSNHGFFGVEMSDAK